jgi:hypothetical protein
MTVAQLSYPFFLRNDSVPAHAGKPPASVKIPDAIDKG